MLATRVRDRPCSALCLAVSVGRSTTTVPPSTFTASSGWSRRVSSPFGPLTVTVCPDAVAETPAGRGTGFLPMRDMAAPLPDHRQELAAEVRLARLAIGHQPLRRREDGHAQAVAHAGDLPHAHVTPQPRRRDPPQLADDRLVALVVLQVQAQQAVAAVVQDLEVLEEVVV